MAAIQQLMVEATKNKRGNALKEVTRLRKEFGFTAGMLKGSLAEGRKAKEK
jgi:pyruvate/oxaloacetate carboxyltransferase